MAALTKRFFLGEKFVKALGVPYAAAFFKVVTIIETRKRRYRPANHTPQVWSYVRGCAFGVVVAAFAAAKQLLGSFRLLLTLRLKQCLAHSFFEPAFAVRVNYRRYVCDRKPIDQSCAVFGAWQTTEIHFCFCECMVGALDENIQFGLCPNAFLGFECIAIGKPWNRSNFTAHNSHKRRCYSVLPFFCCGVTVGALAESLWWRCYATSIHGQEPKDERDSDCE